MSTLLSILLLGFVLGMRHATDADHVVAVATIVSRQRSIRGAALTGIAWGIGHTLAMLAAGGAIVLCGLVIPERLGQSLEFSVGIMLILLGLLNIVGMIRRTHETLGRHGGHHDEHAGMVPSVRSVCIGIVHGLAGSAAVALLVLPIIRDPAWAMAYLLVFGLGTVAGMMLITATIAVPFLCADLRSRLLNSWMGATTGLLSVGFGGFLIYHIGFVEGLFRP